MNEDEELQAVVRDIRSTRRRNRLAMALAVVGLFITVGIGMSIGGQIAEAYIPIRTLDALRRPDPRIPGGIMRKMQVRRMHTLLRLVVPCFIGGSVGLFVYSRLQSKKDPWGD